MKSTTWLGGTTSELARGAPGELVQAEQARSATIARAAKMARRFIADGSLRSSHLSLLALQSRRGQQRAGIARYARDVVWQQRCRRQRRIRSGKLRTRAS